MIATFDAGRVCVLVQHPFWGSSMHMGWEL